VHRSIHDFALRTITREDIADRSVLEVGARDINGTLRPFIQSLGASSYRGTDKHPGPGVDTVIDAADLADYYGEESFDVVICTETLEHIKDVPAAMRSMKRVLRTGGLLIITARSPGFPRHGYPEDYWRFTREHAMNLVNDMILELAEDDYQDPGFFLRARKPERFQELPLPAVWAEKAP
jgi:SAM-dependent methyltransferase